MLVARRSERGLHYTVRGEGRAIVLLHGWCLSGRMWMYQEELLAQQGSVVCPDLRGFGRSSDLPGQYSLAQHADDVGALLDELGGDDVVLAGFAFGACVAMQLATDQPQRLRRLVLVGVPSKEYSPYTRMPKAMRRDWPDFARKSASAICKQPHSDATFTWIEQMFVATPLPVAIETVGELASFDPRELAAKVRVPSLFVHGDLDDVVPVALAEETASLMPAAGVEVVAESGHLVPIDQAEAVARILSESLSDYSSPTM